MSLNVDNLLIRPAIARTGARMIRITNGLMWYTLWFLIGTQTPYIWGGKVLDTAIVVPIIVTLVFGLVVQWVTNVGFIALLEGLGINIALLEERMDSQEVQRPY